MKKKFGNLIAGVKDYALVCIIILAIVIAVDVITVVMMCICFNASELANAISTTAETSGRENVFWIMLSVVATSGVLAGYVRGVSHKNEGLVNGSALKHGKATFIVGWAALTAFLVALIWFVSVIKAGYSTFTGIMAGMFSRIPVMGILIIVDIAIVIVAIVFITLVQRNSKKVGK